MENNEKINCDICGKLKQTHEIVRSKRSTHCKACKSHANRWLRFGLSPWRYKSLLEEQKNLCAICGIVFTEKGRAMPVVDHCHKTNAIRGVLCVKCNTGIGQLRDSAEIVAKALEYLQSSKGIKPDFQTEVYTLMRFYFLGDKVAQSKKEEKRSSTCEVD